MVGESLIDLIERAGQPPLARVGGSPLNVAVGLSRLGIDTTLHTCIGDDAYGGAIATRLAADGVRLTDTSVSAEATSTARATIGANGAADYEFAITPYLSPLRCEPPGPDVLHTGSIGAALEPGASAVLAAIRDCRSRATISYDPNVRPDLMGDAPAAREHIEALIASADVVKASDEDCAWLYPGRDPHLVAQRWLALGPSVVAITRGGLGAIAVAASATASVMVQPATVVDTIGAGDSFMAGLLRALLVEGLLGRGHELQLAAIDADALHRVLLFASRCAAVTVSREGADPPTSLELVP